MRFICCCSFDIFFAPSSTLPPLMPCSSSLHLSIDASTPQVVCFRAALRYAERRRNVGFGSSFSLGCDFFILLALFSHLQLSSVYCANVSTVRRTVWIMHFEQLSNFPNFSFLANCCCYCCFFLTVTATVSVCKCSRCRLKISLTWFCELFAINKLINMLQCVRELITHIDWNYIML